MNDNLKNKVLVIVTIIFLFGTVIINLCAEDGTVSIAERRNLKQLPTFSLEKIKNIEDFDKEVENFTGNFEKYTLDQFVGRDTYRKLKSITTFYIFNQSDNNDIYIADGHVSKYFDKLEEAQVKGATTKFNKLYDKFLNNMNVYYSIIPDKNYFIAEKNGYPSIDYKKLEEMITTNMNPNMQYINIFGDLTIDDYYKTDIHWRQEKIEKIANKLSAVMGFDTYSNYTENKKDGFYGVYYGQSSLPINSEELIYYTADIFDGVTVKVLNEKTMQYEEQEMYNIEGFNGIDPYDIYLHGAKAAITIENENATSDKELIIFRDSFGSSLVPLLVNGYKKITVLDLRYIATPLLTEEIVEFKDGQDVLIMNYVEVLNSSSILKVF